MQVFPGLRTERLLIRPVEPADVAALHVRRNEPEVAALQAWTVPYPYERAQRIVDDVLTMTGPSDGHWWMATIVERSSDEVIGDLVVNASNELRTAEVGYSLAARHWGRGFAVEALSALVGWLLDTFPLTRLEGRLHPDNRASAMVLERTGFVFEGHTRLSFWLGADNSDDWIYGMTRADWQAWRSRPRTSPREVALVPITAANRAAALALATHHSQQAFVAPVAQSFAEALLPDEDGGFPVHPWLGLVESDGRAVGFVMVALVDRPGAEPHLWRLLIDRMHQGRGIGTRVLELVATRCRQWGASGLLVSWAEGKGSPAPFYLSHGFVPTGRVVGGEVQARRALH
jgi:RimJ/RimL family protein N-acetyltransferase/GNAT superfamily N-acetyltransferase